MKRNLLWCAILVCCYLLCSFGNSVCAQPAVVFQDKSVEEWMETLKSEKNAPHRRVRAARFLGVIGNRDAVPLLKKMLEDKEASVRRAAIRAADGPCRNCCRSRRLDDRGARPPRAGLQRWTAIVDAGPVR